MSLYLVCAIISREVSRVVYNRCITWCKTDHHQSDWFVKTGFLYQGGFSQWLGMWSEVKLWLWWCSFCQHSHKWIGLMMIKKKDIKLLLTFTLCNNYFTMTLKNKHRLSVYNALHVPTVQYFSCVFYMFFNFITQIILRVCAVCRTI